MKIKSIIFSYIAKRKLNKINHGNNVALGGGVKLMNPNNIYIEDNTYVNGGYLFAGDQSKIYIGKDCLISYEVHIRTESHNYKDKNMPIRLQGVFEKDIVIEDDCWIGFGAQIMPGVHIAKGTVIGAGAIVTHDTEAYGVYAGVPAIKISNRE